MRCAASSVAGYLGWLWKTQGRDAMHIFIFHTDLEDLLRLHREVLRPLRLEGGQGGNVPVAFSGPYLHETTLGLVLQLFLYMREPEQLDGAAMEVLAELLGLDPSRTPAPLTLYVITGKPGSSFNMQEFQEFSKLHALYRLYEGWLALLDNSDNPHQTVVRIWRQFQTRDKNQYNTLWRDKIAWAILEFGDPFPWIENFLFEARVKEKSPRPLVWGTEPVLTHYAKEVLGMEESLLKVLGGFGYSLGTTARAKNEMGLLFALRNAKNPEDFYKVLNDIQFRLELTVPEALLRISKGEKIGGSSWLRVKTLLSIYAMNAYLRAQASSSQAASN